ncbi:MAG: ABC transporter ATP-binding protein [Chloroflexi bacterium]|nr:ABC transporter ATP-binding protein [Chloroflexota bacterium]
MTASAIRVEKLGKRYRIGERETYRALRDTLTSAVTAPLRRLQSGRRAAANNTIWALRDVSLEVAPGEVLGVIGHNGAGKSTLLKILSRITEPSEGRAEVRGRVGSLLEVGTGFHPELTGRENIFLNGAILGMKRAEITRRFDEMVAFAGVERFIDTPVKRYSSGMYLRLAFAVAAHLEPEILLVDEVLAVGDAAFQKKCLGRMSEVAREGRTVLFVSHNLASVEKLCQRVIIVDGGRLVMEGDPVSCIATYLGSRSEPMSGVDLAAVPRLDPRLQPVYTGLELRADDGTPVSTVGSGEALEFHLTYSALSEIANPSFGIIISNGMGMPLFFLQTRTQHGLWERAPREGRVVCRLDEVPLVPGEYLLTIGCMTADRQLDLLEHVASFSVEPRDFFDSGYLPPQLNGPVLIRSEWQLREARVPALTASVAAVEEA